MHSFAAEYNTNAMRKKNILLTVLLAALLLSCGIRELGEIENLPGIPDYIDPPLQRTVTMISALEYPEGSDWNHYVEGAQPPELVLYRDSTEVLRLRTGEAHGISEDLDMQRVVNGHLYTDWCTDTETILSRDGVEIFRYSGRERIVFLSENSEGHVLTLGEARSGKGFSSRVDGMPVFLGFDGSVYPNAEMTEEGKLRFFYTASVNSTAGQIPQYYIVTGGECVRIEVPQEVTRVFGFAVSENGGGDGGSSALRILSLCRKKNESGNTRSGILDISDGTFISMSGSGFIHKQIRGATVLSQKPPLLSSCTYDMGSFTILPVNAVFKDKSCVTSWISNRIPIGFRHCADSVVGVVKSFSATGRDVLCNGSRRDTLPAGYTVMSGEAVCCSPKGIKVGLTSRDGRRAILWDNGKVDSLNFRGIVTSVTTSPL